MAAPGLPRTGWHALVRHLSGAALLAALLAAAGAGCIYVASTPPAAPPPPPVDPARVYAAYRFDRSPGVLNFGVQPLWIPACILWEAMSRDPRLNAGMARAGCRLVPYAFFKGQDLGAYVMSGQLQGGVAGDLPVLAVASERDVRVVSLVQQGPCAIVAGDAIPMERLRGRRIGYAPGSNAHYALLDILREHGLRPADVRLVPMEVIGMADALAAGRIDAFAAWEPTPTLALLDHPGFDVIARADCRGYMFFTRAFADVHPQVVRELVAAETRALSWLRANDKNLYIASRWARRRAADFQHADPPLTVYDYLRLARRDLLRVPTAPRLSPAMVAPGGPIRREFELSQQWGLLSPTASWSRIERSFVVGPAPAAAASGAGSRPRTAASGAGSRPGTAASGAGSAPGPRPGMAPPQPSRRIAAKNPGP